MNIKNQMNIKSAALALLDAIDYTKGNCKSNQMIGAVLPAILILNLRNAIDFETKPDTQRVAELKPCPFCGSDDVTIRTVLCIRPFEAGCNKCFAQSATFDTKEQARDAWNTRALAESSALPPEEKQIK